MDDWVFGTVLRHAQIAAVVMFVCGDSAGRWWGMWLDGDARGKVVRFSGRRSEPAMWMVAS